MTYRSRATAGRTASRFRFISEIIAELKKATWLSRREVVYLTVLVLLISVAMGVLLGVIDFAFAALVNNLFLGG